MTPGNIKNDLRDLTANVQAAHTKPGLRSTLGGALVELGYDREQIDKALDEFFAQKTVH